MTYDSICTKTALIPPSDGYDGVGWGNGWTFSPGTTRLRLCAAMCTCEIVVVIWDESKWKGAYICDISYLAFNGSKTSHV
ncbi:hypothetical protein AKJ16_DCAP24089 [Drosera capensis]